MESRWKITIQYSVSDDGGRYQTSCEASRSSEHDTESESLNQHSRMVEDMAACMGAIVVQGVMVGDRELDYDEIGRAFRDELAHVISRSMC